MPCVSIRGRADLLANLLKKLGKHMPVSFVGELIDRARKRWFRSRDAQRQLLVTQVQELLARDDGVPAAAAIADSALDDARRRMQCERDLAVSVFAETSSQPVVADVEAAARNRVG